MNGWINEYIDEFENQLNNDFLTVTWITNVMDEYWVAMKTVRRTTSMITMRIVISDYDDGEDEYYDDDKDEDYDDDTHWAHVMPRWIWRRPATEKKANNNPESPDGNQVKKINLKRKKSETRNQSKNRWAWVT